MLCLAVAKLPEGPEWQLELKLDGYRGMGIKSNGRAHLASRNGKNFSERFPTVTRALNRLPDESVIDGEIVAVNEEGLPSFNFLQNFGGAEHTILFYAFDLLILAGTDLRSRPLEQRRSLLRELIPRLGDPIRHSETFDVPVAELLATVRQHGPCVHNGYLRIGHENPLFNRTAANTAAGAVADQRTALGLQIDLGWLGRHLRRRTGLLR
jgi:ATP-dependent DNA ligase